jgi:hypothetical protein
LQQGINSEIFVIKNKEINLLYFHCDSLGAGGIRQTAKAPVYLRILGGFAIYIDGSVDGFEIGFPLKLPFIRLRLYYEFIDPRCIVV